jgi:uncharacterized protein (DUF362 family)
MTDKSDLRRGATVDRRGFLKAILLSGLSGLVAACRRSPLVPAATPPGAATLAPTIPRSSPTASTPTRAPTPAPEFMTAVGQADAYDPRVIRRVLEEMLGSLGGWRDKVSLGARVGIKVNLTGGTWWDAPDKPPATEMFVTHPVVVAALCEILRDMGVGDLILMDGLGDESSFQKWGYADAAAPLGAQLLDLCRPEPFADFGRFPVGQGAQIYDEFSLHPAVGELDMFISVGKLKCHSTTGVTLSLKNLIGLAPIRHYRLKDDDNNRSAFHGSPQMDTRLPRVILDLCRARPIDLALIDGVITAEGGAGPWDAGLSQVRPGLLVAGSDPVAADAVATRLMGFDPQAPGGTSPFLHADNHLALAHDSGLGTHLLREITIGGAPIEGLIHAFHPAS